MSIYIYMNIYINLFGLFVCIHITTGASSRRCPASLCAGGAHAPAAALPRGPGAASIYIYIYIYIYISLSLYIYIYIHMYRIIS